MTPRSSWSVVDGVVVPLGTEAPTGRARQRAVIRERIARHGTTETARMHAAKQEIKRRIAARSKP